MTFVHDKDRKLELLGKRKSIFTLFVINMTLFSNEINKELDD